jgi:aryl-alcohol dehydrogenase-like predicted oxidoreductase
MSVSASSRLALGTVQLGLSYGVANRQGQVSREEGARIVHRARVAGLDTLDTAIAYGESERRLGEIGVDGWRVITKLPAVPADTSDVPAWVERSVTGSLARLGTSRLAGLLLHRSRDLLTPFGDALWTSMLELQRRGLVARVGVSVYDPEELDALWPAFPLELVQGPFNVLDRRLATSGWLSRLHSAGTEIHVRSVFLQGLLLMESGSRPSKFARWQSVWREWDAWLAEAGRSSLESCLQCALAHPEIDRVVVGVDTLHQLEEILAGASGNGAAPPQLLVTEDLDLINPSHWNAL